MSMIFTSDTRLFCLHTLAWGCLATPVRGSIYSIPPPVNAQYSVQRRLLFCGWVWGRLTFGVINLSLGGIFHPRPGGIYLFLLDLTYATILCVRCPLQFEGRRIVRVLLCGSKSGEVGPCLQSVPLIVDQTSYCNNWYISISVFINNYSPFDDI